MAALARSVLRYSARHEAAASDSFADHVDQRPWRQSEMAFGQILL